MKYPKTWGAIEDALKKSTSLTAYSRISRIIEGIREYKTDVERLEWNLIICAGNEMLDDLKAPIWNRVVDVWHEEKKEVENAKTAVTV